MLSWHEDTEEIPPFQFEEYTILVRKRELSEFKSVQYEVSCFSCDLRMGVACEDDAAFPHELALPYVARKVLSSFRKKDCAHIGRFDRKEIENLLKHHATGVPLRIPVRPGWKEYFNDEKREVLYKVLEWLRSGLITHSDAQDILRLEGIWVPEFGGGNGSKGMVCRQCRADKLQHYFTSKRDGTILCDECFSRREKLQLAREVEG